MSERLVKWEELCDFVYEILFRDAFLDPVHKKSHDCTIRAQTQKTMKLVGWFIWSREHLDGRTEEEAAEIMAHVINTAIKRCRSFFEVEPSFPWAQEAIKTLNSLLLVENFPQKKLDEK